MVRSSPWPTLAWRSCPSRTQTTSTSNSQLRWPDRPPASPGCRPARPQRIRHQQRIGQNIRPVAHQSGTGAVREGCAVAATPGHLRGLRPQTRRLLRRAAPQRPRLLPPAPATSSTAATCGTCGSAGSASTPRSPRRSWPPWPVTPRRRVWPRPGNSATATTAPWSSTGGKSPRPRYDATKAERRYLQHTQRLDAVRAYLAASAPAYGRRSTCITATGPYDHNSDGITKPEPEPLKAPIHSAGRHRSGRGSGSAVAAGLCVGLGTITRSVRRWWSWTFPPRRQVR